MIWFSKPKVVWHLPEGRKDLLPAKATPGSMAYDLQSPTSEIIPPRSSKLINTLVSVTLPKGYAIILGSRSGLAAKERITVEAGWIDNDYRGFIKVLLYNHGDTPLTVSPGQRIAQAMLVRIHDVIDQMSYKYPDTTSTKRGSGGFGSTGK
jgi:dUTP pyrophosphatase